MNISCIIPVYNEAKRVGSVIDVVVGHPHVDEVIVVNDGSTDNSLEVLRKKSGIKIISHEKNRGKTFALMRGIQAAKNSIVTLIDSDLLGLRNGDISALIAPVIQGRADMTISLRKNSLAIFRLLGMDFVSGERVFDKKIIGDLTRLEKLPGFGFEVFLNEKVIEKNLRLEVVNWPGVITPRKAKKIGWWAGRVADNRMVMQIISLIKISGVVRQMRRMRALRVRNDG